MPQSFLAFEPKGTQGAIVAAAGAAMTRAVFRDRRLNRQFLRDGYVLVEILPRATRSRILELQGNEPEPQSLGVRSTMHGADPDHRAQVDRVVRGEMQPLLDELLLDYRLVIGVHVTKDPVESSELPAHQDWMFVDESSWQSVSCWMPLTATTEREGRLAVLPGSHRFVPGLRGSPAYPTALDGMQDAVKGLGYEIDVPLGCAVIHDNSLVHWSGPNRSADIRVAATLTAVPQESQLLHWFFDAEGQAHRFSLSDQALRDLSIGEPPPGQPEYSISDYEPPAFGETELIAAHRRRSSRWRRTRP